MALGIYELAWMKSLMKELMMTINLPMKLYYDSNVAISIAHNYVQYDRTKHVEIDQNFTKEKIENCLVCMTYISSGEHLADVLTKGLLGQQFQKFIGKSWMGNIYKLAWGECWKSTYFLESSSYVFDWFFRLWSYSFFSLFLSYSIK